VDVIKASEFKAKCLGIMDAVAETGRPVVITKNGKPVAALRPYQPSGGSPFGIWQDQVHITGDIISPLDVEWEALK
jgi:prevent-host-death family protein